MTLTYFTAATVRENRIEDFNSHLRRRHLNPREPGRSTTVDTAKICAMGVQAIGRRLRSAAVGTKQRFVRIAGVLTVQQDRSYDQMRFP